jgi:hypothetical protein
VSFFLGVAHKVGAVVKASITAAAQSELVFVNFGVAFFFCEFETGLMLYGKHRGSGGSGSGPVVGGSGSHSFVRSLLSQLPSGNMLEKYFNFIQMTRGSRES